MEDDTHSMSSRTYSASNSFTLHCHVNQSEQVGTTTPNHRVAQETVQENGHSTGPSLAVTCGNSGPGFLSSRDAVKPGSIKSVPEEVMNANNRIASTMNRSNTISGPSSKFNSISLCLSLNFLQSRAMICIQNEDNCSIHKSILIFMTI